MTPTAVQEQIKKHFKSLAANGSMPTRSKEALMNLEDGPMPEKEKVRKASRRKAR